MRDPQELATLPIAAVERDSGLSKDTLRVWERRYGFPAPMRDASDERVYPIDQVLRLRAIKRLIDLGHRPGKIIALSLEELQAVAQQDAARAAPQDGEVETAGDLQIYVDLIKTHRVDELRRTLSQAILRVGLARFVTDVVAPMNVRVGDAWARGHLDIFEEHLYTESIQLLLRNAIHSMSLTSASPSVLLTTLPKESHALGMLMAQTIFALEGARCVSLGVETPLPDIVLASQAARVDIVALSFSSGLNPTQVLDGLGQLRARLASDIQIWAGGTCPILHRRALPGILAFRDLTQIGPALVAWRVDHPRPH
jgi:DNA-binding transcriptional MerR regulator/methylmalonyl-CoA mutase cobalamin-binding subunit